MLVVKHIVENAVQTFLGTHKAFNAEGYYVDSSHTTASGRQLVAWCGIELGSRRERANHKRTNNHKAYVWIGLSARASQVRTRALTKPYIHICVF